MAGTHLPKPRDVQKTRRAALGRALRDEFGRDLEAWRAYVSRIKASRYLMTGGNDGEFRPSIDWALKPANMRAVLEGAYDRMPVIAGETAPPQATPSAPPQPKLSQEPPPAEQPSEAASELERQWQAVQGKLRAAFGDAAFISWLAALSLNGVDQVAGGDRVELSAPSRFVRDWVQAHYADRIRVLWQRVNPSHRRHRRYRGSIAGGRGSADRRGATTIGRGQRSECGPPAGGRPAAAGAVQAEGRTNIRRRAED